MGTLKTEKLQPNYKMPTNNISHNIGFVKSLSLIVTKKKHFLRYFFNTYDRKHRLCHRYFCRRKSPIPDTFPDDPYHNRLGRGIGTPPADCAEPLF